MPILKHFFGLIHIQILLGTELLLLLLDVRTMNGQIWQPVMVSHPHCLTQFIELVRSAESVRWCLLSINKILKESITLFIKCFLFLIWIYSTEGTIAQFVKAPILTETGVEGSNHHINHEWSQVLEWKLDKSTLIHMAEQSPIQVLIMA